MYGRQIGELATEDPPLRGVQLGDIGVSDAETCGGKVTYVGGEEIQVVLLIERAVDFEGVFIRVSTSSKCSRDGVAATVCTYQFPLIVVLVSFLCSVEQQCVNSMIVALRGVHASSLVRHHQALKLSVHHVILTGKVLVDEVECPFEFLAIFYILHAVTKCTTFASSPR